MYVCMYVYDQIEHMNLSEFIYVRMYVCMYIIKSNTRIGVYVCSMYVYH
jgi:hypothetical protein